MPIMRCINASGYELTQGNIYNVYDIDAEEDGFGDTFCHVLDDNREDTHLFYHRFEPVEEEGENMPITVGTRVRVRTDLVGDTYYGDSSLYCSSHMLPYMGREAVVTDMYPDGNRWFYLDITDREWTWSGDLVEVLPETTSQAAESQGFAVGDIIQAADTDSTYNGGIGYIQNITERGILTSLSIVRFRADALSKVNEQEILNPVYETEIPNEYTQKTGNIEDIKTGVKVKLPTRKTIGTRDLSKIDVITKASDANQDFAYIYKASLTSNTTYVSFDIENNIYNQFNRQDLEYLNTNFVQGALEAGHRIKDAEGRTHTYEPYDSNSLFQRLLKDTDDYIDFIDSTGWFVRVWKALVTKTRGTVQYTEYMAMNADDYAVYKAETEARMKYIKTEIENSAIRARNNRKTDNMQTYNDVKRNASSYIRQEAERAAREAEERRQIEELTKHGIWKHHVWN